MKHTLSLGHAVREGSEVDSSAAKCLTSIARWWFQMLFICVKGTPFHGDH